MLIICQSGFAQIKEFEKFINKVEQSYSKVKDYSCKLYKKEFINNRYKERKNIILKYMKPNFYYLKWTEGEDAGREAIFAGEKYHNNIRIHLGGLMSIIDVEIDPNGEDALKDNRHSVHELDIGFIIKTLKLNIQLSKKLNEGSINFVGVKQLEKSKADLWTLTFPQKTGFYAHKIMVYFDKTSLLPVKFSVWDWNEKLLEMYHFMDMKINTGLTEYDFDADNPEYGY